MKKQTRETIKRITAVFLSAALVLGAGPTFYADEVDIDVNNPQAGFVADPTDEPQIIPEKPAEPVRSPEEIRQSAAVEAANRALQEQNAAVSSAKNERTQMETQLQKAEEVKEELVRDRDELNGLVSQIDGQLQEVTLNLSEVENLLAQKEEELAKTSAKLIQARQAADDQYENMKIRIKFMYEKGTTDFVQILLSAGSFSDLLNKAEYIEQLSAYDRNMLKEYEEAREEMAELEEVLGVQQEVLNQTKQDIEAKRDEVAALMSEKEIELNRYNDDIALKKEAIREYEEMIEEQDATIQELEAAAEKARKQQQEALAAQNGGSVSGNYVSKYGGGQFCWPAPSYTRISDDYGMRIHPTLGIEKFHNGVDMAAPSGSSILAAADGYVVAASYSATMGNYIMIEHGSGIYTIYMHASALYVAQGQNVRKGDIIGAVGSTGRSTGAHLHFSVRVNGQYVSPWNYL